MDWVKICQEFGLVGGSLLLILAAIMTMCGFGFKWILEQFKVELEGNRKERVEYLSILHKMGASIDDHNVRSKDFCISQTSEHKEMAIILGRINGYRSDAH